MYIINIEVLKCSEGDILADDVFSRKGNCLLAAKDTILNQYILKHLTDKGINAVRIYSNKEDEYHSMRSEFQLTYIMLTKLAKNIFQDMVIGRPVNYSRQVGVMKNLYQSIHEDSNILRCISEIREKDEYTFYHSINVAFYAMLIGKWLQLSDKEINDAILSGLLHDIGKTGIPNEILNKSTALTKEEFDTIKKHTIYGYKMVKDFDFLDNEVKDAILLHHERLDGTGYPYQYTSDNINLYARIVAIADVFDAMTSERVYKRRTTPFEVFRIFLNEGSDMFDQGILNVFMKNLTHYLIGSRVLLSDGRSGEIVYIPYHNLMYPIVRIAEEYIDLATEYNLRIENML